MLPKERMRLARARAVADQPSWGPMASTTDCVPESRRRPRWAAKSSEESCLPRLSSRMRTGVERADWRSSQSSSAGQPPALGGRGAGDLRGGAGFPVILLAIPAIAAAAYYLLAVVAAAVWRKRLAWRGGGGGPPPASPLQPRPRQKP